MDGVSWMVRVQLVIVSAFGLVWGGYLLGGAVYEERARLGFLEEQTPAYSRCGMVDAATPLGRAVSRQVGESLSVPASAPELGAEGAQKGREAVRPGRAERGLDLSHKHIGTQGGLL